MARHDRPRVTVVTPACNCLKGLKAGDAAARGMGVGARHARGKTTLGGCGPGRGKGRSLGGLITAPTPGLPSLGAGASTGRGPVTGQGTPRTRDGPRGPRGRAGTLTRRRRGEAACSPSAEYPSPWPRRCRWCKAAGRISEVARSACLASLRRPPAPPPCTLGHTSGSLGPRPPRRGRRPLTGLCGASRASSGTLPRGRHVAGAGP